MADETDFAIFKKNKKQDEVDKHSKYLDNSSVLSTVYTKRPIPAKDDHYNVENPKVGLALIFNHKIIQGQSTRVGTERDRDRMQAALKLYGFEVRIYEDRSYADLIKILTDVSKEDHSNCDCLCVIVMSHGLTGKVFARDIAYPVEHIWLPFLGSKSPTLVNKPKLFFLQACRGDKFDEGVQYRSLARSMETQDYEEPVVYTVPSTADLLIMFSSFEGNYSWRNPNNGSWFIQALCQELESAADDDQEINVELLYLLTSVARRVAYEYQSNVPKDTAMDEMKQMPTFVSTLTKIFYLRRKLFKRKTSIFS